MAAAASIIKEIDYRCSYRHCVKIKEQAEERCSLCRSAMYCGRACQLADWPEHKFPCTHRLVSNCLFPFIEQIDQGVIRFSRDINAVYGRSFSPTQLKKTTDDIFEKLRNLVLQKDHPLLREQLIPLLRKELDPEVDEANIQVEIVRCCVEGIPPGQLEEVARAPLTSLYAKDVVIPQMDQRMIDRFASAFGRMELGVKSSNYVNIPNS